MSHQAGFEPEVSEWGNPFIGNSEDSTLSQVGVRERTQGTETSKYLEEKKSTEIPLVVASERGSAQTEKHAFRGCRTCIREVRVEEVSGKAHQRG